MVKIWFRTWDSSDHRGFPWLPTAPPRHALEDLQGANQALDAQQIVAFFEARIGQSQGQNHLERPGKSMGNHGFYMVLWQFDLDFIMNQYMIHGWVFL